MWSKPGEAKLARQGEDRKEEPNLFELSFDGLHLGEATSLELSTSLILNNFFDRRENPLGSKRAKDTISTPIRGAKINLWK